jgi:hypothetical protein
MNRLLVVAGMTLALAACQQGSSNGGLSSLFNSSPASAGNSAGASAAEGCRSGQQADFLHQNRPGGSDYSALRCGVRGY